LTCFISASRLAPHAPRLFYSTRFQKSFSRPNPRPHPATSDTHRPATARKKLQKIKFDVFPSPRWGEGGRRPDEVFSIFISVFLAGILARLFRIFLPRQNPMCRYTQLSAVEVIPDTLCVHQKSEKII